MLSQMAKVSTTSLLTPIGKTIWKNGNRYVGSYKQGLRHGHGYITYPGIEESYKGDWKNDTFDGVGIHCTKEVEYRGEFEKGRAVSGPFYLTNSMGSESTSIWSNRGLPGSVRARKGSPTRLSTSLSPRTR